MKIEPDKLGDNEEKCNNFVIEFGNSEKCFFFKFLLRFSSSVRQSAVKQQKGVMRSNATMRWQDGKNTYL